MPPASLHSDLNENLEDFFVQPELRVVQGGKIEVLTKIERREILSYKDLFETGKNIYIQGNPGTGKSTYSKKLAIDWCRVPNGIEQEKQKEKHIDGLEFDFLFLVSLGQRFGKACEVVQLVEKAVISQLAVKVTYKENFLSRVLDRERCLVILDGLDEWSHPKFGACGNVSQKQIPHRAAGGKCVYITLSRPWKLSQIRLEGSEIDALLEIRGVREQEKLFTKTINILNKTVEKLSTASKFITATKHLSSLAMIPIVSVQLVCLWNRNKKIPGCLSDIYASMIKMMLENVTPCQESTVQRKSGFDMSVQAHNVFLHLGKLAFETLFPEDGCQSRVLFAEHTVRSCLGDDMKRTALSAGLLTKYKIHSLESKTEFSFLHRNFQEFLAAYYISLDTGKTKGLLSRVKIQSENMYDVSQLFIFLCGLAPALAAPISQDYMAETKDLLKRYRDVCSSENILRNTTDILKIAYTESVQNFHDIGFLKMTHLFFSLECQPVEQLMQQNVLSIETIWCKDEYFNQKVWSILMTCSKTITTLCLPFVDNSVALSMCRSLQAFTVTRNEVKTAVCLDLSRNHKLEYLDINQRYLVLNIITDALYHCSLVSCDLSQGNLLESLTKQVNQLRHLSLKQCTFSRTYSRDRSFLLDVASSRNLEELNIIQAIDDPMAVSIITRTLRACVLERIDLSAGNLLASLRGCSALVKLDLYNCFFSNKTRNGMVCIDMSACETLSYIRVVNSGVEVKFKNLFIGRERGQTLWIKNEREKSCLLLDKNINY